MSPAQIILLLLVLFIVGGIIVLVLCYQSRRQHNDGGWQSGYGSKYGSKGFASKLGSLFNWNGVSDRRALKQHNFVSDVGNTAEVTDVNTINSWGVLLRDASSTLDASDPTVGSYVANNGTGTINQFTSNSSTLLNTFVVPPAVVMTDATPTGLAWNPLSTAFTVGGEESTLFTATEDGTVSALVPVTDPVNLQIVINNNVGGAVYKGIAMTSSFIFVTNFNSGFVEIYDSNFVFVSSFTDPALTAIGYAPFNVKVITFGCGSSATTQLVVTFAQQDDDLTDDVPGIGHGYVDIFELDGTFVRRLVDRGHLNSPWGLTTVEQKSKKGKKCKSLLVGNHGDGQINIYSLDNGRYWGPIRGCYSCNPSVIDELWGIEARFHGHDSAGLNIFFAAGIEDEEHGLYGRLSTCWYKCGKSKCGQCGSGCESDSTPI